MIALAANNGSQRPHAVDLYIIIFQIVGSVSSTPFCVRGTGTYLAIYSPVRFQRMLHPSPSGEKLHGVV
jgi:hypothetical protein